MSEILDGVIDLSRGSLVLRPRENLQSWILSHSLPQGIGRFFGTVSSGILFPMRSPNGDLNGFEILESTLFWTVNELLGNALTSQREPDCFDACRVLFSAVADQCVFVGVDLNENHHGWFFMADINPGNNPAECSFYIARSFEDWLELNMRAYSKENSERWSVQYDPKLGSVSRNL